MVQLEGLPSRSLIPISPFNEMRLSLERSHSVPSVCSCEIFHFLSRRDAISYRSKAFSPDPYSAQTTTTFPLRGCLKNKTSADFNLY